MLIANIIYKFFLFIDGVIYDFIRYLYEIFLFLSNFNIFQKEKYLDLVQRLYAILSVVMLFVLAYALLRAVVNPDEFSKGDNSFPNMIKNTLISLVIIAILPTVFDAAFSMQKAVLNADIVGKIVLPGNSDVSVDETTLRDAGGEMAMNIYDAFLYPADGSDGENIVATSKPLFKTLIFKLWVGSAEKASFKQVRTAVMTRDEDGEYTSFRGFTIFHKKTGDIDESDSDGEGLLIYNIPFSTVAGIFVVWTLMLYCFDLAIRTIKLAFYQIIAPIPAVCRIIPNGEVKKVWNNWVKLTTSTFLEVFIRLFVMYLGVFMITLIIDAFDSLGQNELWVGLTGFGQKFLVKALLIMGVIVFIRNAPKIIQDLFGIDVSGMNLGLKGLTARLSDGGALAAGSALGAGFTGMARNATHAVHNVRNANTKGDKARAIARGIGSTFGGGFIGSARRGLVKGASAKDFSEMKKSKDEAVTAMIEKRDENESARYATKTGKGLVKDKVSLLKYKAKNMGASVANWAGYKNIEDITRENALMDKITTSRDNFDKNTESMIIKEFNKGNTAILGVDIENDKISGLNLGKVIDELNQARQTGVGLRKAEKKYSDIMNNLSHLVQQELLVSDKNWAKQKDDVKAKFAELREFAVEYRGNVRNASHLDALKKAGINGADFADNVDVKFVGAVDKGRIKDVTAIDSMGNNIKLQRGENNIELTARSKSKPDDGKK